MAILRQPVDELAGLQEASSRMVVEVLLDIARARIRFDGRAERAALDRLADIIAGSQAIADVIGRRHVWAAVDRISRHAQTMKPSEVAAAYEAARGPNPLSRADQPLSARLAALTAVEKRINAHTIRRIKTAYSKEHGRAIARETMERLSKKLSEVIARAAEENIPIEKGIVLLRGVVGKFEGVEPWTRAYAETFWRTNVAAAHAAGKWNQLNDPAVRAVIGGMMLRTKQDNHVRPNHAKLHGFIAGVDDPVWNTISPPLGFRCRCSLTYVTHEGMVKAKKTDKFGRPIPQKIPKGGGPDKGWIPSRPDRNFY
jgi:SPP1 gp7 family putative phage head morphogenesis protein